MNDRSDTPASAATPARSGAGANPAAADYATVAELIALYRRRAVSPVEIVKDLLARIEKHEPSLHCFVTQTPELALARAREAEAVLMRGPADPLCGIPYGLKDVIETAGVRTTGQSKVLEHNIPQCDAEVAARMKQPGGVLLGKLTTYEFAHGGPSWDLPWPPAMNPWKAGYLPGSTSSGAGAALAAGLLPAAIGTDTGGSIRMPAAVCGIVGVKPTYGLVSRRGVLPNTFTFDTCGPMARTVEDAAIVLNAIAGYDDEDVSSVERAPADFTRDLSLGVKGLRIGWVRHWYDGGERCHPDIAPAVAVALDVLAQAGAIVEEIRLSDLLVYQDCKTTISITEMFSAYEHEFRTRPQDFGLMFRNKVLSGALIRAEDYFQALRQRLWLARELARAFKEYDVLATAGWMTPAEPAHPDKLDKFLRPPNITTPFNIGGQPAMNIPCGFSREGLPLSLQLAAAHFEEALMFRVGQAYQQLTNWHTRRPIEGMTQ
ncbi:MAG: amidase [Betaproteobacteria bacterium]|nr:amidase [Betaproteobacteria bacterium]